MNDRAMIPDEGDGMYQPDTMNEEIAVIIEQYADHSEARLPGMGPQWHAIGATPDEAIEQLMERLRSHQIRMSSSAAPIAVSLLTVQPEASNLRPPTVVYSPEGVMALFYGDLDPIEPPPPEAAWLKPGERLPEDAPDGSEFVTAHRTPPFHPDRVVIRSHHGGYRLLHHTGGSVLLSPAAHTISRINRQRKTSLSIPPHDDTPDV